MFYSLQELLKEIHHLYEIELYKIDMFSIAWMEKNVRF